MVNLAGVSTQHAGAARGAIPRQTCHLNLGLFLTHASPNKAVRGTRRFARTSGSARERGRRHDFRCWLFPSCRRPGRHLRVRALQGGGRSELTGARERPWGFDRTAPLRGAGASAGQQRSSRNIVVS